MFKKIFSVALVLVMLVGCVSMFASCTKDDDDFKIGIICLHDEKSTYDKNFLDAIEGAKKALGLKDSQVLVRVNVPETNECYEAAKDLVDQGCSIVFADSFGHEAFLIKAAREFPDVQFCHATGVYAALDKDSEGNDIPDNLHNAFASIYEGRYLAGVAAGLKLNEMIESGKITAEQAKMGYVGAFTYAEVISGYTSFYLGAKSVCPSVTMEVTFTGAWYDVTAEKEAANKLIGNGCVLISQHADSMGAPSACEAAGVPNISYNGSTVESCPNTFIVSSRINWEPYFEFIIKTVKDGENGGKIPDDWCGSIPTESVLLTDVNTKAAAAGTQAKIDEVKAKLVNGELHVFDTSTFTVTVTEDKNANVTVDADKHMTSYKVNGQEVVKDGYFHESEVRSAPYFEIQIDGITLLDVKY
ncbi:MAG: BMP family ABC transporter substrate-binding protein [Eubacteriales bacterium]